MSDETKAKSAEEWAADFWKRDFVGPTPAVNDCFVNLFREIQQDARRAAMMEAAELVLKEYPPKALDIEWADDLPQQIAAAIKKAIDNPR